LGGSGALYSDTPMMTFNESGLQNVVALGLLEPHRMVASYSL
jgi:hypothetical protein